MDLQGVTAVMIGFQFLIGRLETVDLLEIEQVFSGFQFLIGRLETDNRRGTLRKPQEVSIPHR